ncbi:MAG TPA: LPS assembly lipoprotein LptE [Methylophilaceae bacterium]|jgi:LPS-assembly lipoprotein
MQAFRLSRILLLSVLLALTACGFHMRGTADLAFKTLYIQGGNLTIKKDLIRSLKVNGVTVVNDPKQAELLLDLIHERRQQNILSLSGGGLVREYELVYFVEFRLRNPDSEVWGPIQRIEGRRDYSYDDSQLLAKQFEEERLYEDMRVDAVREIMRLLVAQKPKNL